MELWQRSADFKNWKQSMNATREPERTGETDKGQDDEKP